MFAKSNARPLCRAVAMMVPAAAGLMLAAAVSAQPGSYYSDQGDRVIRTPHVVPAPSPSPYLYSPRPEGRRWNPAPIHDGPPPVYSPRPLPRPLQVRSAGQTYSTITPPASVAAPANPRSSAMPSSPSRADGKVYGTQGSYTGTRGDKVYSTQGSYTGTRGDKVYGTQGSSTGTRGDKVYRTQGNTQQRQRQPYSGPINVEVQPVVPMPGHGHGHGGKPRPPAHHPIPHR